MKQNQYASPFLRRAVILSLFFVKSIVRGVLAGMIFAGLVFAGEFMAPIIRQRPEWLLLCLLTWPLIRMLAAATDAAVGFVMLPYSRWQQKRRAAARERQLLQSLKRKWLG